VSGPFEDLAGLDKLIHEPARLSIVSALETCATADFLYLQRLTGLTKGNLSAHLTKLDAAGIVTIDKEFVGRTPKTWVTLTETGRETVATYWARMAELRDQVGRWTDD
jgi:DNA-binding transcriptional ArsR family regulator